MMSVVLEHYFFGDITKYIKDGVVLYDFYDIIKAAQFPEYKVFKYQRTLPVTLDQGACMVDLKTTAHIIHYGNLTRTKKRKLLHWLIEEEGNV